jgi:hypothetical protein
MIEKHGRMSWQRRSSYNRRSLVVSMRDHYWPSTAGPNSPNQRIEAKDRMQRARSDDEFRHAGLGSNPVILDAAGQMPPTRLLCTKATAHSFSVAQPVHRNGLRFGDI